MEFKQRPVLLKPTVNALLQEDFAGKGALRLRELNSEQADARLQSGVFVDGTFGRGGHSRELLGRIGADARLFVFDEDHQAIAVANALAAEDNRAQVVHGGFATMRDEMSARGVARADGVMLDLGVSSPQIDDAQRGFSFMRDGPLDMRMDTTRGPAVGDWLAQASVDDMRKVIAEYGEKRFAFRVAKAIAARRAIQPLHTTFELAECVASAVCARKGAASGHTHLSSFTDLRQ